MTNRKVAYIVKDQKPLMLATHDTVQHACRCMRERRAGSVLVIDEQQRLSGIFTGRDAVRTLAEGKDAATVNSYPNRLALPIPHNVIGQHGIHRKRPIALSPRTHPTIPAPIVRRQARGASKIIRLGLLGDSEGAMLVLE